MVVARLSLKQLKMLFNCLKPKSTVFIPIVLAFWGFNEALLTPTIKGIAHKTIFHIKFPVARSLEDKRIRQNVCYDNFGH